MLKTVIAFLYLILFFQVLLSGCHSMIFWGSMLIALRCIVDPMLAYIYNLVCKCLSVLLSLGRQIYLFFLLYIPIVLFWWLVQIYGLDIPLVLWFVLCYDHNMIRNFKDLPEYRKGTLLKEMALNRCVWMGLSHVL